MTQSSPATVPGYRIALIILGIAMSPVLLAASTLGSHLVMGDALRAILSGSLVLCTIGCLTGWVGVSARMNTYQIVRFAFGTQGSKAINALFALALFGWTCVTANSCGHALQELLAMFGWQVPMLPLVLFGGVLFIGATAFGFEVLDNIALVAIPVLILLLSWNLQRFFNVAPFSGRSHVDTMSMGVATSSVVGTFMILATTMPDFASMVHNRRHALIGAILALGVAYPALFVAGAVPCALSGKVTLAAAMALAGAAMPAVLMLLIATITGNAGNLFQATLVTSTFVKLLSRPKITLLLGVLACLIGSLDILSWFIPFLVFLGIAVPPIAGIYLTDYALSRRGGYDEAVLAHQPAVPVGTFVIWGVATLIGFLASRQLLTLTAIPSLDALLTAAALYALKSKVGVHRRAMAH
ncbi:cytosine permease [Paludibacterium purpuratum]|uniref:Purine-cytosine permease-like protein n=1 Tax=Paludibacterium purpuratum TaxID=1144873 RepID=A0A4R7AVB2_9NEIS|nr:cytosine permease [Paludibacterium purpuratum]TDR71095.1 purine-cytosine permease-like protein [Paludibacterium purpuratum]